MQKLYIAELSPNGESLEIDYLPKEVSFNRTATVATIEVAGKNNSPIQWTGGDTSANITIGLYSNEEGRQDVLRKVDWLQSLTYSDSKGVVPRVILVYGKLFKDYVFIVKSVSPTFEHFNSYVQAPIQAKVSIELLVDTRDRTLLRQDIRNRNV